MGRSLTALAALLGALAFVPAGAAAAPAASPLVDTGQELPAPPTPELIDQAQEDGEITLERATQLRVRALGRGSDLPERFESETPYDGTLTLLRAQRDLKRLDPGPARREVTAALRAPPGDPNLNSDCGGISPVLNDHIPTDHFYIQYTDGTLEPSLTVSDYAAALEGAWSTEVDGFGWAAPPDINSPNVIDDLYHVRIENLAQPGLYGFVTSEGAYAGRVGNNPSTPWDDVDADATCMVLNADYQTGFRGTPQGALEATAAHEFNHSLQFGYGALSGANQPDSHFVEGGATWMEDEVFDGANDNYNFLYPTFQDSMGEHDEGDIYAYWLTFRGLTERFGTNAADAGEDVMQSFWERTSRNEPGMLTSLNDALGSKGSSLPRAYHDYSIAAKYVRACGGGYALPLCFEEGADYQVATGGQPSAQGSVASIGGGYSGSVEDNYALNWVALPTAGSYDVVVRNTSDGGVLRVTLACDSGAGIALAPLAVRIGKGGQGTVSGYTPGSCQQPVAVITNESQTAPNATSSEARTYSVETTSAPATTFPVVPPADSGSGAGSGPIVFAPAPAPAPAVTPRESTPRSRLAIGKVKVRSNGIVLVRVRVSGAGKLVATSTARTRRAPRFKLRRFRVARRTVRPEQGRLLTLRLTANKEARRVIRSQPRRRIRARTKVVFRPANGAPRRTKFKAVTFRLRR